ncbi:MAG: T9SS type A sorting domain-containing protein [Bacteroidota bacterium]
MSNLLFSCRSAAILFLICLLVVLSVDLAGQPANDLSVSPTQLTLDSLCTAPAFGTLADATSSGPAQPGCAFGMNADAPVDVWYTFVAPDNPATLSLELAPGVNLFLVGELYSTSGAITFEECFMTFGALIGNYSTAQLVPGETYLLRVYDDATGTSEPFPGQVLDFTVCLHTLPTLETGNTFGAGCNDAFDIPAFTGSGEWKYITVNNGLAIGILDNQALAINSASLFADFGGTLTTTEYGQLLRRSFAVSALLNLPTRVRLFFPFGDFQQLLGMGLSVDDLLLHNFGGSGCLTDYPAGTIPDFGLPQGFGKVGQSTVYLEYTVDHFSALFIGEGNLALPLQWGEISGVAEAKRNRITWSTLRETNTDHFVVQRSTAGALWETVGQVPAAGNSVEVANYELTDEAPPARALYRILQVDIDGRSSLSEVIQLRRKLSLLQNPVGQTLRLAEPADVTILDLYGRQLASGFAEGGAFPVADLPSGTYLLRTGETTQKFVKQ